MILSLNMKMARIIWENINACLPKKIIQSKLEKNKKKKKRLKNPFTFCNNNIKTFILLIRKGVHNCEWEKFNETSLLGKEEFKRYRYGRYHRWRLHACKKSLLRLWNKTIRRYHGLYFKSDAYFFADVFENLKKMCLESSHLDSAKFCQLQD